MKFKNTSKSDMTIRGVKFPKGKAVEVNDDLLARKLSGIPDFEQVKAGRKKNDKNAK